MEVYGWRSFLLSVIFKKYCKTSVALWDRKVFIVVKCSLYWKKLEKKLRGELLILSQLHVLLLLWHRYTEMFAIVSSVILRF